MSTQAAAGRSLQFAGRSRPGCDCAVVVRELSCWVYPIPVADVEASAVPDDVNSVPNRREAP